MNWMKPKKKRDSGFGMCVSVFHSCTCNREWTFTWRCQHITWFSLAYLLFSIFNVQRSPQFCILHVLHFIRVQLYYNVSFAHAMCWILYHSFDCIVHISQFSIFSFIWCENNWMESTVVSHFKWKYAIECVVCLM